MRIARCNSCGAEIVWLKTKAGKAMPVNAATVKEGEQLFDHEVHRSHFASCPNAAHHRRAAQHARTTEKKA